MADVVMALAKKRSSLINQKKALEIEYKKKLEDIERQIEDIDKVNIVINDAISSYICPKCGGSGVVRFCDAAGDTDGKECIECKGLGIQI